MKVTFPHMGTAHLTFTTLFADLGLEPVPPPPTSQHTLALGVKYAPEFACLPLKVNIGNYLEAFAAGAEAIIMVGGVGPCRLGYYAETERNILRDLGYTFDMVVLEPPHRRWRDLWHAVRRLIPRVSLLKIARALVFAYHKSSAVDEIERLVEYQRPYEIRRGETSRAWADCQSVLAPVTDISGLRQALRQCRERLAQVELAEEGRVLRVAVGGEFFMVLEPAVNLDLMRVLGENGAVVHREIYLSAWIREQLLRNFVSRRWFEEVKAKARPYLGNFVGGHGLESVAQAVHAAVNRFDGMIQVAPFTCMPEIIAQCVLPRVSRGLDLPVITLIFDEHSAETGVLTRVEAFLDLLARRQKERGMPLAAVSPLVLRWRGGENSMDG